MEISARNITLGSIAGAIILIGSVLKVFGMNWTDVAWISQARHIDIIEEVRAEFNTKAAADTQKILDAIGELSKKQDNNHMQWLCDEDHEELIFLLEKEQKGGLSVEERERVNKLRENLSNKTCGEE